MGLWEGEGGVTVWVAPLEAPRHCIQRLVFAETSFSRHSGSRSERHLLALCPASMFLSAHASPDELSRHFVGLDGMGARLARMPSQSTSLMRSNRGAQVFAAVLQQGQR